MIETVITAVVVCALFSWAKHYWTKTRDKADELAEIDVNDLDPEDQLGGIRYSLGEIPKWAHAYYWQQFWVYDRLEKRKAWYFMDEEDEG